jgi:hypothetical protein
MNTTESVKVITPETYPLLADPYAGKSSMSQKGENTTYGVSTRYSAVDWSSNTTNSTYNYGMDGLMSTIKLVAQNVPTYSFMNTIQLNYNGTWATGTVVQAWTSFQGWDFTSFFVPNTTQPTYLNVLCQYTVGGSNSTSFVRSSSGGLFDILNTTGAPINTRSNVTIAAGGMLTSNEQYRYSNITNWTSITCPMQRSFNSTTEPNIKVGDSIVYKSGFKVY